MMPNVNYLEFKNFQDFCIKNKLHGKAALLYLLSELKKLKDYDY